MAGPASRRELVVAVVAATLGGSIVAAAFTAASFLRMRGSHLRGAARDCKNDCESTGQFFLWWIRPWFSRLSIKLLGSGTKLAEEQVDSLSKSSTSTIYNGNVKPDPFNQAKRKGYLSWDDYFMAIAFLSAKRSKDPNRQVGACIVSQDQVILGIGYNGFPRGCCDDKLSWAKMSADGDPLKTKYPYVCHAEVNAILNKNHASATGQRLYVTMFPCNECAKVIIQARIAEVVYFTEKGEGHSKSGQEVSFAASRKLLTMAGVKISQYKPSLQNIVLEYR